jgi:hypothetical protein
MICSLCKKDSDLIYMGKGVCSYHWEKHCDGKIDLRKKLKIEKEYQVQLV